MRLADTIRRLLNVPGQIELITRDQALTLSRIEEAAQIIQRFSHESREKLVKEVVESVGYRGDGQNSLFRAFIGTEQPITSSPFPVPFSSTLCQQAHFGLDQYPFGPRP